MVLTQDGRWLLVAAQAGTAVLSVAALEYGADPGARAAGWPVSPGGDPLEPPLA